MTDPWTEARAARLREIALTVLERTQELPWEVGHPAGKVTVRHVNQVNGGIFLQPKTPRQVWMGIERDDLLRIEELLSAWEQEMSDAYAWQFERLAHVYVIICTDLQELTELNDEGDELGESEAFVLPYLDSDDCRQLSFLLMIPYPQPFRSREAEVDWLLDVTVHELEHIWQFLTIGTDNVGAAWRDFSEMCAMKAEQSRHPGSRSFLDYGLAFQTRFPQGVLSRQTVDGMIRVLDKVENARKTHPIYWYFPFLIQIDEKLKSACGLKDGCRAIWRQWRGTDGKVNSPWLLIDESLQKQGYSLSREWVSFCQAALRPNSAGCEVVGAMNGRFTTRAPSWRVDMQSTPPMTTLAFQSWPLGAHWVQFAGQGKGRRLNWGPPSSNGFVEIHMHDGNGGWSHLEVPGWEIPDNEPYDFLVIHTHLPSPTRVPDFYGTNISIAFEEPPIRR
ncbi:hypothetical protein DES53_111167 [Roseimicrobium gellanilyticum]|uniref:Uncharacterized protein n=1 Tax=Roseimicrobium gellanilyticum TaxID=748857 RepID=A0A366H9Z2_9BACT|nr:hypothetical protein [Roseimicrobium gellanilyticum]RBP38647.1 hypothetical protein DES53_111167 [Roseimicrobium gellanilyticum]